MDLSHALSIVVALVILVMGIAVVMLASMNLAIMLRSAQIPRAWAIVVTCYEIGLSILIVGVEIDLSAGAGAVRKFIYTSAFLILLVGLAVQSRIVGNRAERDQREAAILRQRINLLKSGRGR